MSRRLACLAVPSIFFVLLACLAVRAEGPEPSAYGDDYQPGNFGRVRYQENGVTVTRAATVEGEDAESELAEANEPIFPGDLLVTGPDQRVEIELAGGALIRVDRDTEVTFLALPDPYSEFRDNTVLQLHDGALRLRVRLGDDETFRVDSPASSIYVLGDADLRIEVDGSGGTEVSSWRGVAEVVGDGGSVLVRGGMQTVVEPGDLPEEAYAFNTFLAGSFDRWVDARDGAYRDRVAYAGSRAAYDDLPDEVRPYYRELSYYGGWIDTADYGHVWCPRDVPAGWRPYYDGSWSYGPHGYFWVANEPWGWAPYHYGRWTWLAGHGWAWVPGRVFGGAWVTWSWGPTYVGWAALDYWNRPAYVVGLRLGYYDPHAWTFVSYTHIVRDNCSRYQVGFDQVSGHLHRAAVVTRPPHVPPARLAHSVEWRERAVREATGDVRAHIGPATGKPRDAGHRLEVVESQLAQRTGRLRGAAAGVTPPGRARAAVRAPAAGTAARPGTARADESRFPRRISTPEAEVEARRAPGAERAGIAGRAARSRATSTAPVARRQEESNDKPLRDVYRQMARPRPTRDQAKPATTAPPPQSAGRATARPAPSAAPVRPRPRPATQRSAPPAEPAKPKATPPTSPPPQSAARSRAATRSVPSARSAPAPAPYQRRAAIERLAPPAGRTSAPVDRPRPSIRRSAPPAPRPTAEAPRAAPQQAAPPPPAARRRADAKPASAQPSGSGERRSSSRSGRKR